MAGLPEGLPSAWPIAVFPFLLVGVWIGVCTVLGRMGGWSRLAEAYAGQSGAGHGTRFRLRSGAFGWVSYNSALMLEAGPEGLSFAVLWPFRAGHPPFTAPWSEIRFTDRRRWLVETTELTFARRPDVTVRLPRRLARQLVEAGGVSRGVDPIA